MTWNSAGLKASSGAGFSLCVRFDIYIAGHEVTSMERRLKHVLQGPTLSCPCRRREPASLSEISSIGSSDFSRRHLQKIFVHGRVARQFRMKRRDQEFALTDQVRAGLRISRSTSTSGPTRSMIGARMKTISMGAGKLTSPRGALRWQAAPVAVADHRNIGQAQRCLRRDCELRAPAGWLPRRCRKSLRRVRRAPANSCRGPPRPETSIASCFRRPARLLASTPSRSRGVRTKTYSTPSARERCSVSFKITLNGKDSNFHRGFHFG